STPWSARTYAYEVSESHNSHMLVIDYQPDGPQQNGRHGGQANGAPATGTQNGTSANGSQNGGNGHGKSRIGSLFSHPEQTVQQRRLSQQETAARRDDTPALHNPRGWLQRLRPLMPPPPPPIPLLVAYGGLWRMMDEAHVSTI